MRLYALVLALAASIVPLAGQPPVPAVSICGSVDRSDTHRAVASAWVSIYSVGPGKPISSPVATQMTAADGSFCFHTLVAGEYLLLPHKAGMVPAFVNPGRAVVTGITARFVQTVEPLHLSLIPVPSVTQAPDHAFRAMYTSTQRASIGFVEGSFSPSGRYLAFEIAGINSGDAEQVWRYDLSTHRLLAITPKSTELDNTFVDGIAWDGDVLYTKLNPFYSRPAFFKTDGDSTIPIPSWPAHVNAASSRHVEQYSLEEEMTHGHGGGTQLLLAGKEIADLRGGWTALDDPPVAIVSDWKYQGIVVIDLRTHRRRVVRLPAEEINNILAAWHGPNGLRIAYEEIGECVPAEGLARSNIPGNDNNRPQPHNLCFVDVKDQARVH